MHDNDILSILEFMRQAENLKNTLRFAYTTTGRHESAAEHSWRLCLFVLLLSRAYPEVDMAKMFSLAIIHDLAEAKTGDIPAIYQDLEANKSAKERQSIVEMCSVLPEDIAENITQLWDEYETGQSLEGRLVKGLDKLETLLQHTQGINPSDFNYEFNLQYARQHTEMHPLLQKIRAFIDVETNRCIEEKASIKSK